MLTLLALIAVAQVDGFSPPPLVQAESTPPSERLLPPPLVRVEESRLSYQELQTSFLKELELTRQVSAVSLQIAELDVSGPAWAVPLRVLGYVLVVPAFVFFAPVMSGKSVAVGTANLVSTTQTLTPTFDLVGLTLTVVTSIALGVGIGAGIVGWVTKRWELDGLRQQKASLERQLEEHRLTYRRH